METSLLSLPAAPAAHSGAAPTDRTAFWRRGLSASQPALVWAGWLHVALLAGCLLLWPLDERTVTGLNVWIKPAKFSLSGVLYLWTLARLLADVPAAGQRTARRIGFLAALSMVVEISCIVAQAARGTTSHFNVTTASGALVFNVMGAFIALNTLAIAAAVMLVLRHRPLGAAGWAWGIRLGLLVFLVGSVVGGVMAGRLAHTVGAADGGPGLPVLGWSTRHGDLRAAHFLGLHALQALPLAGWLLSRLTRHATAQRLGVALAGALYVGVVAWLYSRAMQGLPLFA